MSNLWDLTHIQPRSGSVLDGDTIAAMFWNAVAQRGDKVWLREKHLGIWRSQPVALVRRIDLVEELQREVHAPQHRVQAARQAGPALAFGVDGGARFGRREQRGEQAARGGGRG